MAEEKQEEPGLVKAIFNRYSAISALISIVITTVGYYNFLDKQVEELVRTRLQPYELIFSGIASNEAEDFEEAISSLRQAAAKLEKDKVTPETLALVDDALLYAIVNCSSPTKYSPEFERINSRIGPQVSESGWRRQTVGWYYLRTGKAQAAKEQFERALQLYDAAHERKLGAYSLRGLMLASLAEGDTAQAVEYLAKAAERSPLDWDFELIAKDVPSWSSEEWILQMQGHYGETFTNAVKGLEKELLARVKKRKAA